MDISTSNYSGKIMMILHTSMMVAYYLHGKTKNQSNLQRLEEQDILVTDADLSKVA